jgi:hypothetical protein
VIYAPDGLRGRARAFEGFDDALALGFGGIG